MLIKATYLNHYCGTSVSSPDKIKDRACWAEVEVDVAMVPKWQLQQVLFDDDGYRAAFDANKAFSYDGHYWVVFEAASEVYHQKETEKYTAHCDFGTEKSDFRNYSAMTRKAFAWATFEYSMFPRVPGRGVYATQPENYRKYKPVDVEWDDRAVIERKARRFYESNLLIGDDTVYCRIEAPVLPQMPARERWGYARDHKRRVFTPYGGHGDPIMNFDAGHAHMLAVGERPARSFGQQSPAPSFFAPIPGYRTDNAFRHARAIVSDMFTRHPDNPPPAKKGASRHAKRLQDLFDLWNRHFGAIDEVVLDEAIEIMLDLDPKGVHRQVLEDWLDRPVVATLSFPGSKMAAVKEG